MNKHIKYKILMIISVAGLLCGCSGSVNICYDDELTDTKQTTENEEADGGSVTTTDSFEEKRWDLCPRGLSLNMFTVKDGERTPAMNRLEPDENGHVATTFLLLSEYAEQCGEYDKMYAQIMSFDGPIESTMNGEMGFAHKIAVKNNTETYFDIEFDLPENCDKVYLLVTSILYDEKIGEPYLPRDRIIYEMVCENAGALTNIYGEQGEYVDIPREKRNGIDPSIGVGVNRIEDKDYEILEFESRIHAIEVEQSGELYVKVYTGAKTPGIISLVIDGVVVPFNNGQFYAWYEGNGGERAIEIPYSLKALEKGKHYITVILYDSEEGKISFALGERKYLVDIK